MERKRRRATNVPLERVRRKKGVDKAEATETTVVYIGPHLQQHPRHGGVRGVGGGQMQGRVAVIVARLHARTLHQTGQHARGRGRPKECLGQEILTARALREADKNDEDAPESGTVERLQEKIAAIRERRERLEGHGKALAESGEDQISLTDPDARAMYSSSRVGVGYNIQIAVDTRHKLIAEQQVHNKVSDLGLLTETAKAARETLAVDKIDAVADRGYFKIEDIETCETAGIVPYVPKPQRGSAVAKGFFTKDQFSYDVEADTYMCPGGAALSRVRSRPVRGEVRVFDYANAAACKSCALKARCTGAASRKIARYENEAVLDRMAKRLAARPGVLDERRESVEHPFGSVKQWMGQAAFLMRRLENVRAEFSLTAIAYNLRRAITLVGIPALIAAVRP